MTSSISLDKNHQHRQKERKLMVGIEAIIKYLRNTIAEENSREEKEAEQ